VRTWLLAELRPGDLCLTLGAGDLTSLPDEVIEALRARRP
jgi:UDP-N-acetylmuramate-alanine ligase